MTLVKGGKVGLARKGPAKQYSCNIGQKMETLAMSTRMKNARQKASTTI